VQLGRAAACPTLVPKVASIVDLLDTHSTHDALHALALRTTELLLRTISVPDALVSFLRRLWLINRVVLDVV